MSQTIPGTPNADTLPGRADLPDEILGEGGDDSLTGLGAGTGNVDALIGGDGNDTLVTAGTGLGYLEGGDGNDSVVAGASGIDSGVGGAGNDTLIGDAGTDYLTGDDYDIFGAGPSASSGNDVIDGGGGDDVVSGGPGDDTLSPGSAGMLLGYDRVIGGDGNDVLALEGAPQDYEMHPADLFLVSIPATGPGSGVRTDVQDVEQVAFGVTAQELAAGEVPLTLVDWFAMFEGSANSGVGRPQFSLSDTVQGARGEQQVAISIADLLANDFDPDGDTLTLVSLQPYLGDGITNILVITDPADITNEGYDPADFPEGMLLAFLDNPLTAPLRFTYRTAMEANGAIDLGSTATVTIEPTAPVMPDVQDDSVRGTIGGTIAIPFATLLANDQGVSIFDGGFLNDGTFQLSIDRSAEIFYVTDFGTTARTVNFEYSAEDVDGIFYNASVQVVLDNRAPVATNQTLYVQPGVANTFDWGPIVRAPGNADPDGDPVTLAFYNGSGTGPFGTLVGFGNADLGGITFTPVAGYTGGFSINYGIVDQPDLDGAQSTFPYATGVITFAVASPLVAGDDTVRWSFGSTGSMPVTVLLANDSGDGGLDVVSPGLTPGSFVLSALGQTVGGLDTEFVGDGRIERIAYTPPVTPPARLDTPFTDSFTYRVRDEAGQEADATVTIVVDNFAPDAPDVSIARQPGRILTVAELVAFATDLDGDTLTVTSFGGFGNATYQSITDPVTGLWTGFALDPGAGETSGQFFYSVADDSGAYGNSDGGIITVDFSAPPTTAALDAADAGTVGEGNAPTATSNPALEFVIRRTGDLSQAGTVTFVLDAAPGSALTADDIGFVAAGGDGLSGGFGPFAATFAAGQDTEIIFVYASGDRVPEANEAVRLTLTGGTGATLSTTGPLSAIGTFANDDVFPEVSLVAGGTASAAEGDATGGIIPVTIRRTGDLSYATEVTFTVAGLDTTAAADIAIIADNGTPFGAGFGSFTVTFAPGETDRTINIVAAGDTVPEADERFTLTLTGASLGTLSSTEPLSVAGTILNDDVYPEIALVAGSFSAAEGDGFGGVIPVTIRRTGDLSYATEVTFTVAGLDTTTAADIAVIADGGTPFGAGFGSFTVTFAPGETDRTINIVAAGDAVPEANERFTLTLTGASLGTLSATEPLSVTGTILNDDVYPEIALSSASAGTAPEGDATGGQLQFVITRTGDLAYASVVTFSVGGSGGTTGDDIAIVADGGTAIGSGFGTFDITFAAGETQRTITVIATSDTVPEQDEDVVLALLTATEGTLSSTGPLSATGTFADDDATPNAAPDDIALSDLRVAPYLGAGDLVAEITGTDVDAGDALTYSFAPGGNPRGFFAIDGDTLELARPLPFTNGALLSVTLRATDLAGATYDETFVIEVGRDRSGTAAGERIVGRNSDDRLRGLDGNDVLLGRDGDDLLDGGGGNDTITGQAGSDSVMGDAGDDRLLGGAGNDSIAGGAGRDVITTGDGADTVAGGADAGTAVLRGPHGLQRAVLTDADYIDLRQPGTLLPDGNPDLLLYAVGTDGVDLVRGFETGRDAIRITLNGDSLAVQELANGTWIGFMNDAGGILLLGATGLVPGTDILIA